MQSCLERSSRFLVALTVLKDMKFQKGTKSNVRAFKVLFHLLMFSNNMLTGLNTN
jgi:hypothetical protein